MRVGWNFKPLCKVLEKGRERAACGQEKGLSWFENLTDGTETSQKFAINEDRGGETYLEGHLWCLVLWVAALLNAS